VSDTLREPAASADVFDEVFRLLTPERLLNDPRANGEGVRVCVVDTGVERAVIEEKARRQGRVLHPIEGAVFTGQGPPLPYEGRQSAAHGTTVADIILTLAPRVRLYSADVFGPRGDPRVSALVQALYWAMDRWRCKIINLSLGVPEHRLTAAQQRQKLLRAIEEAYYRDVLVFAAADNEHPLTRSYPAVFAPPLISVDKHAFTDPLEFSYELRHQVEFQAYSRGYLGPFIEEPATSWATPHLAGIAARILSLRPAMKPFEIKTILYWLSRHYQKPPATAEGR
jgi:subtilisin family serine protease